MTKRAIAPHQSGSVRLRLLEDADLPATLAWRNQDEIRQWFFYNKVLTLEQHLDWFNRYQAKDTDFVFVIEACEPGQNPQPVGQISLYDINWETGRAEYGRLMVGHPAARGKGYAKAASVAVLEIARELGLKEIVLEVLGHNERAFHLYRTLGFEVMRFEENTYHMRLILE